MSSSAVHGRRRDIWPHGHERDCADTGCRRLAGVAARNRLGPGHPRHRQAGRTGLVDGRHDRPGPGGPAPCPGAPPGAVRHVSRDRRGRALAGGNPDRQPFPADQVNAYNAFTAAISEYPAAPAAPADAKTAQAAAVTAWWDGTDATGRKIARISVPTLIAGGTDDRLDPVANDHTLARLIPGPRLVLSRNLRATGSRRVTGACGW